MPSPNIHKQLLQDCHHLGSLPTSQVLLNRNAAVPWFILVPETRLQDILDLPDEHRYAVLDDCAAVSAFIKQVLGYDKVNFAGLGNVVPDMHLHVIGRREGDACWPQPVWGNLQEGERYTQEQLLELQDGLSRMTGLDRVAL
ncbi:MAG: diadenosine tetraphosphate (Ap4A) HIT family hydrolase [Bacteroidia bacterium]|jgi:diadenosine tetraphosphate (Ap4A) HIT family hydrolase